MITKSKLHLIAKMGILVAVCASLLPRTAAAKSTQPLVHSGDLRGALAQGLLVQVLEVKKGKTGATAKCKIIRLLWGNKWRTGQIISIVWPEERSLIPVLNAGQPSLPKGLDKKKVVLVFGKPKDDVLAVPKRKLCAHVGLGVSLPMTGLVLESEKVPEVAAAAFLAKEVSSPSEKDELGRKVLDAFASDNPYLQYWGAEKLDTAVRQNKPKWQGKDLLEIVKSRIAAKPALAPLALVWADQAVCRHDKEYVSSEVRFQRLFAAYDGAFTSNERSAIAVVLCTATKQRDHVFPKILQRLERHHAASAELAEALASERMLQPPSGDVDKLSRKAFAVTLGVLAKCGDELTVAEVARTSSSREFVALVHKLSKLKEFEDALKGARMRCTNEWAKDQVTEALKALGGKKDK